MKIAVAADHAGFELKDDLRDFLRAQGHEVEDLGTQGSQSVDYPDFAAEVARRVAAGRADRGLLVCGTGIGMAMTANRFEGVRAVQTSELEEVRLARSHNRANVLALGARLITPEHGRQLLSAFLDGPFDGDRHVRRIAKIDSVPRRD